MRHVDARPSAGARGCRQSVGVVPGMGVSDPCGDLEGGSLLRETRPSGARGERTRVRARRAEEPAVTLHPAGRTRPQSCCPKAA